MGEHIMVGREDDDFVYDASREAPIGAAADDDDDASSLDESSYMSSNLADDSGFDDGLTSGAPSSAPSADKAFADTLARTLSRDVRAWFVLVTFMLVATAVTVTTGTFVLLNQQETDEYEQAFLSVSYQLGDLVQGRALAIANAIKSTAESTTSYVQTVGTETWPFVTLPDFEVRGESTREGTSSEIFAFAPILTTASQKFDWNNNYSRNPQTQNWLAESYDRAIGSAGGLDTELGRTYATTASQYGTIDHHVYRAREEEDDDSKVTFVPENSPGSWLPLWQMSPPPPLDPSVINFNLLSSSDVERVVTFIQENSYTIPIMSDRLVRDPVIRAWVDQYNVVTTSQHDNRNLETHTTTITSKQASDAVGASSGSGEVVPTPMTYSEESMSNNEGDIFVVYPIYDSFPEGNDANNSSLPTMTGIYLSLLRWDWILSGALHSGTETILASIQNTCGEESYTYCVTDTNAIYVGQGTAKDLGLAYDSQDVATHIEHFGGVDENGNSCEFYIHTYSTKEFRDSVDSDQAVIFTVIVAVAFVVTLLFFFFYVRIVQRRQAKVMATAARTNAIVTSLFPSNVRDRIMKDAEEAVKNNQDMTAPYLPGMGEAPKKKLKTFLDGENPNANSETQLIMFKTKPIADLFPETTVMFADLVGFTAWSSVREPTQVFQLLETIYHSFDEIARRRRVFKVETVGDCYVAVVGLPDPRKDHAVIMARFARDVLQTVNDLTKKLEVTLGPDTGDLQIRTGLHSGPVTAGVLRGEKSRFQLFGDTVNTAARMESTGAPSRIQLSSETADLLIAAGKSNWIREREEKVRAKGKGELQTYWLEVRHEGSASVTSGSSNSDLGERNDLNMPQPAAQIKSSAPTARPLDAKAKRLVDWNCDQMVRLLKYVVARRKAQGHCADATVATEESNGLHSTNLRKNVGTVLEEVREIIMLPKFDPRVYRNHDDPGSVELDDDVLQQLHDYVSTIATLYRDNPFHNFEHASHVTMSVSKLLSRIVSPQDINRSHATDDGEQQIEEYAWEVHKSTYGITSDPLTQFAVVFSALIHDVDHSGVPNATLVKENAKIAELYKQKSVAEQNSVDLAWDMLMDSKYSALQRVLYTNSSELERFRQLVVNTVMATDIVDKDLKALRNDRWDKAFKDKVEEDEEKDVNRKATIVIEHLIQASDVAHTMQHWHIFRKWNERLFMEMHKAFREGRADNDPSEFWYKGEIGFFDFYIIPLAKKLKECGVFGVSSDEYLNYATKNREEWIVKGEEIVQQMLEKVPKKEDSPESVEDEAKEAAP